MYKFFTISVFLLLNNFLFAQQYTPTALRLQSFDQVMQRKSPLNGIPFRNIGPSIMSGRVVDVEVNPTNTKEFFIAYASGGVWYTNNNGIRFEPIFDFEATHTIGDMAMDWKNNVLWVGTGEVNSSRSSYAGTGMYKTNDRGKTWQHIGLEQTHHIGKVIVHPTNKEVAWVAALGHLYTKNTQRGIFKTDNGGRSWRKVLYINDSTGVVDLMLDAKNNNVLYATSWNRGRKAWNFIGSGEGTAIYKSDDAGERWYSITNGENGFPQGKGVGRIGIAQCANEPNVLYALLDNQFYQKKKKDKELSATSFINMSQETFDALSDNEINAYLKKNGYPKKYDAQSLREDIANDLYTIKNIGEWRLADADASLFDTPIYGAEVYQSKDNGTTWNRMNKDLLTGVYFTYGYYFGTISVSPQNSSKVWIAGYPILHSDDNGKTFKQKDGKNCHPDYHRIWVNPKDDKHIIAANDGGINISYDEGESWIKCNSPSVGQFYAIAVDDAEPYNVYGGLQDNGTWKGSSRHKENVRWKQRGQYGYDFINGGDGMKIQIDTRNNNIVYSGYQFGNYKRTGGGLKTKRIKPIHNIGEKAFRFNWQTPILLSQHNQDILYYGSNCFHRSMNKGTDLQKLSSDLSFAQQKGNVPFGTLTTITESTKKFGLLYVGSDNGKVWRSDDVGYTWSEIGSALPKNLWVSRVVASEHNEGTVYASLNGYRNDDFHPYLYKSEDYGNTWKKIGTDIPYEPINVVREDPKQKNILYVGTDNGLYVSFDGGVRFVPWFSNLPRVAIHDIAIQKRANEIVLGTHGRSIYIADIGLVQKTNMDEQQLMIMPISPKREGKYLGSKWSSYAKPVEQSVAIKYYSPRQEKVMLRIYNEQDDVLFEKELSSLYGWNEYAYTYEIDEKSKPYFDKKPEARDNGKYYLPSGHYIIELETEKGKVAETMLEITDANN